MNSWPEPIRLRRRLRGAVLAATPVAGAPALESARAEARQQGWDEAAAHFQAQLLEQRVEYAAGQEALLRGLALQHGELVAQFTAALAPLTGQIVTRVLAGYALPVEAVAAVVAETLAEIEPGTPEVELHLCPLDAARLESLLAESARLFPGLRVQVEGALRPGDCQLRSRFGAVDGRLLARLQNVLLALP